MDEWYYGVDRLWPIDQALRQELSAGIIASTIHNVNVVSSMDSKPAKEFMVDWGAEHRPPLEDVEPAPDLAAKLDACFGKPNGEVK